MHELDGNECLLTTKMFARMTDVTIEDHIGVER